MTSEPLSSKSSTSFDVMPYSSSSCNSCRVTAWPRICRHSEKWNGSPICSWLLQLNALAYNGAQRHAIDLVLHEHSREDTPLTVVASVEDDRLAAEIGIHLEGLDETVTEDAVTVEGARRLLVEAMFAEVALACDDYPAAAMRTAVLQIDAVGHHFHLSATALKVCEVLFALAVLEGHDVACARVLEFLDDVIREDDTTNFLLGLNIK